MDLALRSDPVDCASALGELLEGQEGAQRAVAAVLLLVLVHAQVLFPFRPIQEKALSAVLEALRGEDVETQLRVCSVLARHGIPEHLHELIGAVSLLLHARGSDLHIVASVALCHCDPELIDLASANEASKRGWGNRGASIADVRNGVMDGVQEGVPAILRAACAAFFLETELPSSNLYTVALGVLSSAAPPYKIPMLSALHKPGRACDAAINGVEKVMIGAGDAIEVQHMAAQTLGALLRSDGNHLRRVIKEYHNSKSELFASIIAGIGLGDVTDKSVTDQLASLMRSPFKAVRTQAVWCLASARPVPDAALENIANHIENDEGLELSAALAAVLSASGAAAIPILLSCMDAGKPRLQSLVAFVLQCLEIDAGREIVEMLNYDWSPGLDAISRGFFRMRGADAQSLVPDLVAGLAVASNDLAKESYIFCLGCTGVSDKATLRTVAQASLGASPEVQAVAELVLAVRSEEAVGVLEEVRARSSVREREWIEKILQSIRVALSGKGSGAGREVQEEYDDSHRAHTQAGTHIEQGAAQPIDEAELGLCRAINDDRLLLMFLYIGRVLITEDRPMSLAEIGKAVIPLIDPVPLVRKLGSSKARLSSTISKLHARLGKLGQEAPLIDIGQGRRSGSALTPAGRRFLRVVERHFEGLFRGDA